MSGGPQDYAEYLMDEERQYAEHYAQQQAEAEGAEYEAAVKEHLERLSAERLIAAGWRVVKLERVQSGDWREIAVFYVRDELGAKA